MCYGVLYPHLKLIQSKQRTEHVFMAILSIKSSDFMLIFPITIGDYLESLLSENIKACAIPDIIRL